MDSKGWVESNVGEFLVREKMEGVEGEYGLVWFARKKEKDRALRLVGMEWMVWVSRGR